MKLDDMRVGYDRDELRGDDLCADPLEQFARWGREACESSLVEPNAMSLATVGADGRPALRTLLLKGFEERGLVFYAIGFQPSFGSRISVFGFQAKAAAVRAILAALVLLFSLRVFAAEPRVLVYQKNGKGFVHDNLAASAAAIQELGKQNGFGVEVSASPSVFAGETLKKYQALIFANSNNEAFENDEQRAAFRRYLRGGGGFMGIHSSTGSERLWADFQQVQGAKFLRHSPLQKFTVNVLDTRHPATAHLGHTWAWEDECYFFTNLNPGIKVLLAVDTKSLTDPELETAPGQKSNGVFPLAWYHEFDGGRVFYTSLGHKIEYYSDPVFRQHILGGIRWVMGEGIAKASRLPP